MPDVKHTMEEAIGLMWTYLGTSWPNPWWPTGNPAYDDCAAAVSWALFGLNGNQPYQTYVSGVIERSGLEFHPGSDGIRRGDAIGFLWGGDNNYDHIELALESPDGAGNFRTVGTNAAPGDDMAVRWRNTRFVVAYGRPGYPSPAGGGSTPIPTEEDEVGAVADEIINKVTDKLGASLEAARTDLKNAVRREGAARGRLLFDAGPKKETPWEKATRAALIANGKIWALSSDPNQRAGEIAQIKAAGNSIMMLPVENPVAMTSTQFNREVDFANDPLTPFGYHQLNWIDLNPAVPGTTWQERGDGTRYPYQNRQAVWEDLRPVKLFWGERMVTTLGTKDGKKFIGFNDGGVVFVPEESVRRANAQIAAVDSSGNLIPTGGTQKW